MRIIAISDTHSMHRKVNIPKGDVLVHAGDFSAYGTYEEFEDFVAWLSELPHKHKVFIAGNHDACMEALENAGLCGQAAIRAMEETGRIKSAEGIHYLNNSSVEIGGRKFYGSPWQPDFCSWSFQEPRGERMAEKWDMIPDDTDVLITHGPAYGHNDLVPRRNILTGCLELLIRIKEIEPYLHICGHIHEGYGRSRSEEAKITRFHNASVCNEDYKPINKAMVIDLN